MNKYPLLESLRGIGEGLRRNIEVAVDFDGCVLLHGETGVGKEVIARVIHGERGMEGEFIPVNCSSIPHSLIESELFGYEKGAFTGAHKKGKPGLIELAEGGTLFLDEVGDMPYLIQAKVLRVLEDMKVWRIGGVKGRSVNFRVICATNRALKGLIKEEMFREDLYYRIGGMEIYVPPLRERREYIEELILCLLEEMDGGIKIEDKAMEALKAYHWPGNVRELKNLLKRIITEKRIEGAHTITIEDIPDEIRDGRGKVPKTLKEKIEALKKEEIKKALKKHNGNRTKAAEELGISRWGLIKMMKSLGWREKTNK